tara:strand:- start:170 stop:325 length:156 start_codon:yes stop_codon:yes gene_type:complete
MKNNTHYNYNPPSTWLQAAILFGVMGVTFGMIVVFEAIFQLIKQGHYPIFN